MATKTVRCACQSFQFGNTVDTADGDVDFEGYTTECGQTTTRTFAMGHDAKLVGYLVRAEMAGEEIVMDQNGVNHFFGSAVNAAGAISDALAAKAQAQLDAAKARIAKKAAREASKTARKSAKAAQVVGPTHRHATVKVGRWEYRAAIEIATGNLIYTNKKGEDVALKAGQYTEVA